MSTLRVLLLLLAPSVFGYNLFPSSTRLYSSTRATETSENIEIAEYQYDLYKVLGVPSSASKEALKEAYWAISARNHPDRNNTAEALSVFRNASHAYKILKDKSKRSEFDAKYFTKQYISQLEGVTNDRVVPFAKDIAIPFLNYTFQSLKNMAVPFVMDSLEASSVVLEEASQAADSNYAGDVKDFFERTALKVKTLRYEQSVRKLTKSIANTEASIASNTRDIEEGVRSLQNISSTLEALNGAEQEFRMNLKSMDGMIAAELAREIAEAAEFNAAKERQDSHAVSVSTLTQQRESTGQSYTQVETEIRQVETEIRTLESQMQAARTRLVELSTRSATIQTALGEQEALLAASAAKVTTQSASLAAQRATLKAAVDSRKAYQAAFEQVLQAKEEALTSLSRQRAYSDVVDKRLKTAAVQNVLLSRKVAELQLQWARDVQLITAANAGIGIATAAGKAAKAAKAAAPVAGPTPKAPSVERVVTNSNNINNSINNINSNSNSNINKINNINNINKIDANDDELCFDFEDQKKRYLADEADKRRFLEKGRS